MPVAAGAKCPSAGAVCPTGAYPLAGGGCAYCSSVACAAGSFQTGCQRGLTAPACAPCPASLLIEPGTH